jgi:signal transduction histidine kinase/CheY-like chemotaxis protein
VTVLPLTVRLRRQDDIMGARQRARQIAAFLGFDATEQTRIATAVSEIARNAVAYASGGYVDYALEGTSSPQVLLITVSDSGPGIAMLDDVLGGRYRSSTGMGLGIIGTRRLMDRFEAESGPEGTTIRIGKLLPRVSGVVTPEALLEMANRLASEHPGEPIEEVQRQNQELLRTLDELNRRQCELERVNRELEDTNRGVVALYAELDERADHLQHRDELKTGFLSNMTHEFRTPVNSILALTRLLAERLEANPADRDELYYIRKSAQQLSDLIDDLLDIAKVEAGKIDVRPGPFEVQGLFGALRGMLRPLLFDRSVKLIFEDVPDEIPPIFSDESKVSQILRNFISNALKYTETGEVRVSARLTSDRNMVEFAVADTGIGIPEQFVEKVFDEFAQIENPLQRRAKGTGLGLPLARRLAELLHGHITVKSTLGTGSTFTATVPLVYRGVRSVELDGQRPVLVVEQSDEDLVAIERALSSTRFQVVPARSPAAAAVALEAITPAAIVLDLGFREGTQQELIDRLERHPWARRIPVVVTCTSTALDPTLAGRAQAHGVKPIDGHWLVDTLESLVPVTPTRVMLVDDEEASRFIIRELLNGSAYELLEAASGAEGLAAARLHTPDIMIIDVNLGDVSGFDLRAELATEPSTARIPVIMVTANPITDDMKRQLGPARLLSKGALTREALQTAIREMHAARPAAGV